MDGSHDHPSTTLHWQQTQPSTVIKITVSVLTVAVSFLSGMVAMSFNAGGKFNEFVSWKADMEKWRGDTDKSIYTMNREGTWASKQRLEIEANEMKRYDLRLAKVEEAAAKTETLILKIENLTAAVNELKAQKR